MAHRIHPNRALAMLAALTVVLVALSVSVLLWEMRKSALERSHLDTASLAHMLREQTERTFETADEVLRAVQERMQSSYGTQQPLDGAGVHLLLASRVLGSAQTDVLAIADDTGRVMNASRDDPQLARSVADTRWFQAFASGRTDGLYIDRPVRTGKEGWTIDMARPFTDASGRFRGVVALTLKVPGLDEFYGTRRLEEQRPISLYLLDGTLVASAPARDNLVGDRPPEVDDQLLAVQGQGVRTVMHRSGDGVQHLYAVARVENLPLVVSVDADDEPALALWRERAFSIGFGAFLVCAMTVLAAAVLAGELDKQAQLERALREAHERYRRTVQSLMDAVVAVDEANRIILFNPAAERMFGIAADEAIGQSASRLVPERTRARHEASMARFFASDVAAMRMTSERNVTGRRADGTEFPIESTLSRTVIEGRPHVTAVLRDVTEQRRAEAELHEMNRQLRELSASLQDVREQERTRIAAELHDELGQQLTGLKLELSWIGSRVKDARLPSFDEIDAIRRQLDQAIASVRRIATELRPRVLDDLGFGAALAWQTREFAGRSGLQVQVDLAAADRVHGDALATGLFRIVQESLTNAARHSGATQVQVELRERGNELVLVVRDNGRGMPEAGARHTGLGLVGMRERSMALGGRMQVTSRPGEGTTIEVCVPLRAEAAEEEHA